MLGFVTLGSLQAFWIFAPIYGFGYGGVMTGVLTTGIYCRPSCAARHPRRENVCFFADGAAAARTGLRACLRCKPDEVTREQAALEKAYALIARAEAPPSLDALAAAAGYSPHHFHRLFKRATGVTPAEYARARRAKAMTSSLDANGSVTDAIYDAGYSGPGRFYADAKARLGMTPSAWRDGGRGETIRWTVVSSALGPMLVAATATVLELARSGADIALPAHAHDLPVQRRRLRRDHLRGRAGPAGGFGDVGLS